MKRILFLFAIILSANTSYCQVPRNVVTNGHITINGKNIDYTATVREYFLPDNEKPAASIIATSYETDHTDTINRPVIFIFNGGPGASSSPLHMHAFGPVRLQKHNDTTLLENNPYCLLNVADLVFIDPIGTGFTKIMDTAKAEMYMDVAADAQSVIDIINRWKKEHHRTISPVFICGESYGTIRAVKILALAEHFPVKGVLLFSALLDMSMMAPVSGNEMPYLLTLPTMSAIAWYYKKIDRKNRTVQQEYNDAMQFANSDYLKALYDGNVLTDKQRTSVAGQLSAFTGLSQADILKRNLRIGAPDFEMLLLAAKHLRIGKLNGQVALPVDTGKKTYSSRDDPSLVVNTDLKKDFVGRYFINTLKFPAEGLYTGVNFTVNAKWKWAPMDAYRGYYSVLPELEDAMIKNTGLKLLVAGGLYDLATPIYAAKYLLNHSSVPKERTTFLYYPTGHSIFENEDELQKFSSAVRYFINSNK